MRGKRLTIDSLSQASCKTLLGQSQKILRGDFETYLGFFRLEINFN